MIDLLPAVSAAAPLVPVMPVTGGVGGVLAAGFGQTLETFLTAGHAVFVAPGPPVAPVSALASAPVASDIGGVGDVPTANFTQTLEAFRTAGDAVFAAPGLPPPAVPAPAPAPAMPVVSDVGGVDDMPPADLAQTLEAFLNADEAVFAAAGPSLPAGDRHALAEDGKTLPDDGKSEADTAPSGDVAPVWVQAQLPPAPVVAVAQPAPDRNDNSASVVSEPNAVERTTGSAVPIPITRDPALPPPAPDVALPDSPLVSGGIEASLPRTSVASVPALPSILAAPPSAPDPETREVAGNSGSVAPAATARHAGTLLPAGSRWTPVAVDTSIASAVTLPAAASLTPEAAPLTTTLAPPLPKIPVSITGGEETPDTLPPTVAPRAPLAAADTPRALAPAVRGVPVMAPDPNGRRDVAVVAARQSLITVRDPAVQESATTPSAPEATSDGAPIIPLRTRSPSLAIAVSPIPQPAGRIFAAAIAAASSWSDHSVRTPEQDETLGVAPTGIATPFEIADRPVVVAAGGAVGALDLTKDSGLQQMIDRIETLRDDANAGDTRVRLIPDALGSIDVAVRQEGDRVHVRFTAEQPATRALIADAQPRLTELAATRGVRIGETSVTADGVAGGVAGNGGGNGGGTPPQPRPTPQSLRVPTSVASDTETFPDDRVA